MLATNKARADNTDSGGPFEAVESPHTCWGGREIGPQLYSMIGVHREARTDKQCIGALFHQCTRRGEGLYEKEKREGMEEPRFRFGRNRRARHRGELSNKGEEDGSRETSYSGRLREGHEMGRVEKGSRAAGEEDKEKSKEAMREGNGG